MVTRFYVLDRLEIHPLVHVSANLRILAHNVAADTLDEYLNSQETQFCCQ